MARNHANAIGQLYIIKLSGLVQKYKDRNMILEDRVDAYHGDRPQEVDGDVSRGGPVK